MRGRCLGNDKAARGVPVQPVHEARGFAGLVGQVFEQPVHMPDRAAATLHGEAMGLVEDIEVVILIKDQVLEKPDIFEVGLECADGIRIINRRDTDNLPLGQTRTGLHAALVDAHLAIANELLQSCKTKLRKVPGKPAIKPHPVVVRRYIAMLYATHAAPPLVTSSPRYSPARQTTTDKAI